MPRLTKEIIEAAIEGFESQKQRIDAQIAELRAMLTATQAVSTPERKPKAAKPGRKLSAAGKRAIVAAVKRRWAEKQRISGASGPIGGPGPGHGPTAR